MFKRQSNPHVRQAWTDKHVDGSETTLCIADMCGLVALLCYCALGQKSVKEFAVMLPFKKVKEKSMESSAILFLYNDLCHVELDHHLMQLRLCKTNDGEVESSCVQKGAGNRRGIA
jgi:hypothetical protein